MATDIRFSNAQNWTSQERSQQVSRMAREYTQGELLAMANFVTTMMACPAITTESCMENMRARRRVILDAMESMREN